jgi:hypothetical protein
MVRESTDGKNAFRTSRGPREAIVVTEMVIVPFRLSQVRPREWPAVLLPPLFGVICLLAAGDEAQAADAWPAFVIAASAGFAVPIVYAFRLHLRGRLFLRDPAAIEDNRSRITVARMVGTPLLSALFLVLVIVGGSARAVIIGALGGACLGFWLPLLANFIRLWRERWSRGVR